MNIIKNNSYKYNTIQIFGQPKYQGSEQKAYVQPNRVEIYVFKALNEKYY